MNIHQYHYVQTLAETGNFRKAAGKLFISQPALTKSINKLEQDLGVVLFDRQQKPITLTYAGERYLAGMQSVMAMYSQLMTEMQEIADKKHGRLRVGIPSTRSVRWMPRIIPKFIEEFPGIEVQVVEGTTTPLELKLQQEEIDLLIASALPQEVPGLDYQVLCDEQMMILTGQAHPLFQGRNLSEAFSNRNALHYISPQWFNDQPFIFADKTQGLYRFATQMFTRFNVHPKKVLSIANTITARDIAVQGVGFLLIPSSSAFALKLQDKDIVLCTMSTPPLRRSLIVSYKKGHTLSEAALRFIDIAIDIAKLEQSNYINLPVVHDLKDLDQPPKR